MKIGWAILLLPGSVAIGVGACSNDNAASDAGTLSDAGPDTGTGIADSGEDDAEAAAPDDGGAEAANHDPPSCAHCGEVLDPKNRKSPKDLCAHDSPISTGLWEAFITCTCTTACNSECSGACPPAHGAPSDACVACYTNHCSVETAACSADPGDAGANDGSPGDADIADGGSRDGS